MPVAGANHSNMKTLDLDKLTAGLPPLPKPAYVYAVTNYDELADCFRDDAAFAIADLQRQRTKEPVIVGECLAAGMREREAIALFLVDHIEEARRLIFIEFTGSAS